MDGPKSMGSRRGRVTARRSQVGIRSLEGRASVFFRNILDAKNHLKSTVEGIKQINSRTHESLNQWNLDIDIDIDIVYLSYTWNN